MTREEAVALLERYSNYEGMGIPNLAGCKEAMKVAAEALKEAYPELAESEDERIRKALVWHLKADVDFVSNGVTKAECIAYLEKQKEVKWSPSECEMGVLYKLCYLSNQITDEDDTELTRLYQDLKREYFNGHSFENMFPKEKQKEQKPVVTHGETYHVDTLGTQQVIAGKMPQKSAEWSEEDEEILKLLVLNIGRYKYFGGMSSERILSFLKSLHPQQRQEWSEEDENVYKTIMDDFNGITPMSKAYKLKAAKWLKFHRPSWKPSEEQMKALNEIVNILAASPFLHQNDYLFNILNGLREELKKLL